MTRFSPLLNAMTHFSCVFETRKGLAETVTEQVKAFVSTILPCHPARIPCLKSQCQFFYAY
uniref:Uncharacterized protein n=1 Tax=Arundo donax TaxID=35708 RepID=A0A0A9B0N5_ARUDO